MTSICRPPLVLVVDDDITTNLMIQSVLARSGFHTLSAGDAAGALQAVREQHPDLILLDVNLPDGSGVDVCRQLQMERESVQTPVLFISADEDIATKVQGFEAGGVDYITKPVEAAEVIARVSTHLRLCQAYERLAELQAERIQRLASAQVARMPQPDDLSGARFQVSLKQVLTAGGDFYDVIPIGQHIMDYIVADASGHDLAASYWTASLKTLLTEYANPAMSPRDVMRTLNNALHRILPEGVFFTIIYARLNRQLGRLQLVNAGHPPACLVMGQDKDVVVAWQEGDVVGPFPDAAFDAIELNIAPGDRMYLFSDGLIELGPNRSEGIQRLVTACQAHHGEPIKAAVPAIQKEVTNGDTVVDDIVLMGIDV